MAASALLLLAAALAGIPHQQAVDAAPMKKYQVYVTLVDVPANAPDLIVNGTINRSGALSQGVTVSSPAEGDTAKLVFRVPSGVEVVSLIVCGTQTINPDINDCVLVPIPIKEGSGPIRVNLAYPT